MAKKIVFVDTSKCTGCKACTVACKEWNELPAEKTQLVTSYQTMTDLTPSTWTYMTFTEKYEDSKMNWMMRKVQCFHCEEAACLKSCSSEAIKKTDNGQVVIDHDLCIGCGYCVENCPFGIPKVDAATKKAYKCTGCADRVENGLVPMCVQTCQPGCLEYGDRDALLAKAKDRLNVVKQTYPRARIYGETEMGGTIFVYLLLDDPEAYGLPNNPTVPLSLTLWKDVIRPVGGIAVGGAAAAVVIGVLGNLMRRSRHDEDQNVSKGGEL